MGDIHLIELMLVSLLRGQQQTLAILQSLAQGIQDQVKLERLTAQIQTTTAQLQLAVNHNSVSDENEKKEMKMSVPVIDQLVAAVAAEDTVVASAITLLNGIAARIQAAVTAALAGGASAADLAPLTALATDIQTQTANLAAAVTTNTPAGP